MPYRAAHPCAFPGCPALVREPWERYCDEHRAQVQRRYDRERGSSAARGYGARWQKLRAMVLRRHPLCADPFGVHAERGEAVVATEVDHIVPLSRGGTNAMDNLQPLCKSCHSRKTALEDSRWG